MKLWHNPRCSKSRQTLQLLRDRGYEPEILEYLKTAPSVEEIKEALKLLKISARELMRTDENTYRELNLAEEADEELLIEAMFHHPQLIERPVLILDEQAAIGRPPEAVLKILQNPS